MREKRIATGWSEEQLAGKLQIDPKDIHAYEAGAKRITADRLLRLSKVLGVKPVYFFGFDDNERPVSRDEALLTLPDQGLRLHRAFIGVKNPALREAIVSLVIELARNETSLSAVVQSTALQGSRNFAGVFGDASEYRLGRESELFRPGGLLFRREFQDRAFDSNRVAD